MNDTRDGVIRVNNNLIYDVVKNEAANRNGLRSFDFRVYMTLAAYAVPCENHKQLIGRFKLRESESKNGLYNYPYINCRRITNYLYDDLKDDMYTGMKNNDKGQRICMISSSLERLQSNGHIFTTENKYYMPIYNDYCEIPLESYERFLLYTKMKGSQCKTVTRDYLMLLMADIYSHLFYDFETKTRKTVCYLGRETELGTETAYFTTQDYGWDIITKEKALINFGLDHSYQQHPRDDGTFYTKQFFGPVGSPEIEAMKRKNEERQGVVKKPENSLPTVENTVTVDVQELKDEVVSDYCDMSLVSDVIGELFDEQEEQDVDWNADEIPEIDDIDFEEAVTEAVLIKTEEAERLVDDGDLIGNGPIQIDDYQLTESEQAYFDVNNPTQKVSWMVWMSDEEFAQTRLCALRREKIKSAKKHGVELVINVPIYTAEEEAILGSADKDMIAKVVAEKEQEAVDKERVAKEQEKKRNQMATKVANWHLKEEKKTIEDDIFD